MTERWRKRLEHLDKESPSDEVFDRAHQGPRLAEAPVGMPSTSTRVVTAIAAFAVFALAISVFAIPVLRLRDQPGSAGQPLLPLWPVRTLDDVERAQAWVQGSDHPGDDLSMFKVSQTLLDPEGVAAAFGTQVMGWRDPFVIDLDPGWGPGAYAEPSIVTSGPSAYGNSLCLASPPAGSTLVECDVGYLTPAPADWNDGTPGSGPRPTGPSSSPAASPFRKIAVYEFDPGGWAAGGTVSTTWLDQAGVILTLFQPLGMAEGNIWTVLDVESSSVGLPLTAGSTVDVGDVIEAPFGWDERQVAAGVHVGAGGGCDVTTNDVEFRRLTINLRVTVPEGSSCRGTVPGYVYVAVSLGDPLDPNDDPVADGSAEGLHALSAVPVLVRIPDAPSSAATVDEPSSTPTPTPDDPTDQPTGPTTYADPLGWSIEVPGGWSSQAFDEFNGRYSVSGAWFSSGDVDVPGVAELPDQPVPADGEVMVKIWNRQGGPLDLPQDSSFAPFSSEALDRVLGGQPVDGTFTADGLTYSFRIEHGDGAPTEEQTDALAGMVASLSFEPWTQGETRRGWTSLGRIEVDPAANVQIHRLEEGAVYADADGAVFVQTNAVAACGSPSWRFYADLITLNCGDGTAAEYGIDGIPAASNTPEFQEALSTTPGILSWNGHVLIAT